MTAGRTSSARTVDIHCHYSSSRAEAIARPHFTVDKEPTLAFASECTRKINAKQRDDLASLMTSVDRRIQDMDRMGIDIQVISVNPAQYYYWLPDELGRDASRTVNDELCALVESRAERLRGMATVPLQNTEFAVTELTRCVKQLGFRAVELSTNVRGEELSSPRLAPFFAAAEELGVLLFIHPLGFTHGNRLSEHYLNNVVGNLIESTIAVSHLIFDGVLDRHPGLRICVAHGGGYLPTYTGRMDHAFRAREDSRQHVRELPSSYMRRLYFDTVVYDPDHVEFLVRKFGSRQVLLGTDYPFDMGESDPLGLIDRCHALSAHEKDDICGGNALRLLGER
jgi:aminocarboxymuconate-semialdehyde decarboxylase